jgi:hypothetical protein
MGCDYGHVLFIGVMIAEKEIFDEVEKEEYGCKHKENDHKYCPECGRLSKRKYKEKVPKIPLSEGWKWNQSDPVVNGAFCIHYDIEFGGDVYIGVYKKIDYTPGPVLSMDEKNVKYFISKKTHLTRFLNKYKIEIEPNSFGIHIIPYLSC